LPNADSESTSFTFNNEL